MQQAKTDPKGTLISLEEIGTVLGISKRESREARLPLKNSPI